MTSERQRLIAKETIEGLESVDKEAAPTPAKYSLDPCQNATFWTNNVRNKYVNYLITMYYTVL